MATPLQPGRSAAERRGSSGHPSGLIATAQPLIQTRTDEAMQFLRINLDLFPQSARTYQVMAQAQVAKKDAPGAIKSLEKALEIDPQNAAARRALDQLKR